MGRVADARRRNPKMSARSALRRLFSPHGAGAILDTTALNAQQLAEITAAAANLKRRFGRLQKVTDHFSDVYALHFDEVLVPTQITIGNSGNISGILFWLPQYKRVDMREIFERIETIGLGSGAIISINDKAIRQVNADTPLSVGSAFKLEILAVYLRQISDGSIKPAEIHRLRADERRPPSGLLQDWPAGTPPHVRYACEPNDVA